ncbi:MAG: XisI protein [Pseudanabaena sp. ELA645]|jgi:serine/threonine protein kinase
MVSLETYRDIVQQILTEYSTHQPAYGEVEMELIFDHQRDRYQLVCTGWNKKRRIYGSLIHIDLKGDKIWIQSDGTEVGIANLLVDKGISKQNIVLAYQAPNLRQFTEFALV